MEHHPTLPPSSFPALQHCFHFTQAVESSGGWETVDVDGKPVVSDSPYAQRGDRIDDLVRKMLNYECTQLRANFAEDEWECAAWIADKTKELIPRIRGLQTKIEIDDAITGEPITFGTCDVWGYNSGTLTLVDAKSGMFRDYMAQLAIYALGLMDREEERTCRAYCVFGDQRQVQEYHFTLDYCEKLLAHTISGINNPESPYNRNQYCAWCSIRSRCPAWLVPGSLSLAAIKPELGLKLREGLDLLLNNPQLMGEFYSGYLDAKKIVEDWDLPGKMLQLINSGTEIEGWKIQKRKGTRHYAKNAILALVQSGLDLNEIASCLKIMPDELDKLLKKHSELYAEIPQPYVGPESKFVIRTNNKRPESKG